MLRLQLFYYFNLTTSKTSRDKSGSISSNELKSVFRALGLQVTDNQARQLIRQMDVDGNLKL